MLFFSPSAFVQSLRFNGVGKSCLSSIFCTFRQSGKSGEIDSIRIHTRFISSVDEVSEFECDDTRDDGKAMEKETALRLAISQLASEFGKECMLSLKRFFGSRHAPVVSTGSLKLDIALGIGGLPKGRIVEIFGQEASGKTTLALHIIKEAQKLGGHCAYLDVENAMNPSLAESIGVKTEALLFSQPNSAENLLSMVDTLVKSGSLDVIVVDSVAALVPQSELDVVMDRTRPYSQSQLMTQALRKIHCSLHQSQTIIIFINQLRAKVRSGHGFGYTEEVTCGGNALKFYAAVRMRIIRKCLLKDENEITGLAVNVQVVKNKLAPAMKKAELEIRFGRGISFESELLDMACEHGVILREANNYQIEEKAFYDKREAEKYLAKNEGVRENLLTVLRNQLFQSKT